MKTAEELNTLKNEISALNQKLAELSEDELQVVSGGFKVSSPFTQNRRCKYCDMFQTNTYVERGPGYDKQGKYHLCDIWQCNTCKNNNYWDVDTGELI